MHSTATVTLRMRSAGEHARGRGRLAPGRRAPQRAIRIVHVHDGHPRSVPSRWEAHVSVEGPAPAPIPHKAHPRVTGLDLGARAVATNDTGQSLAPIPAPPAAKGLARALSRTPRGSKARRRV